MDGVIRGHCTHGVPLRGAACMDCAVVNGTPRRSDVIEHWHEAMPWVAARSVVEKVPPAVWVRNGHA